MELYVVRGCGISAICEKGDSMLWWVREIISRGEVPTIRRWAEAI